MSSKKIKVEKKRTLKLRGHRMQSAVQQHERLQEQRRHQTEARRRRLTKRDVDTGEEYTLTRLGLKDNSKIEEYRDGLAAAIDESPEEADSQAVAIQGYLQAWVDASWLVPIPCERGAKPVCRVYRGENKRTVVIRQDDPDASN